MKKVFMNNEPYEAPLITLVEVAIESGFATSPEHMGIDDGEGEFDEDADDNW